MAEPTFSSISSGNSEQGREGETKERNTYLRLWHKSQASALFVSLVMGEVQGIWYAGQVKSRWPVKASRPRAWREGTYERSSATFVVVHGYSWKTCCHVWATGWTPTGMAL